MVRSFFFSAARFLSALFYGKDAKSLTLSLHFRKAPRIPSRPQFLPKAPWLLFGTISASLTFPFWKVSIAENDPTSERTKRFFFAVIPHLHEGHGTNKYLIYVLLIYTSTWYLIGCRNHAQLRAARAGPNSITWYHPI